MNIATSSSENGSIERLIDKHLVFAWWSLFGFVVLGVALEAMHAVKLGWYLEESYATRRLMWTLGHAHGTVLSLVHVAFAGTLFLVSGTRAGSYRVASAALTAGTILMPGGFFLGGIFIFDGDPGVGVWLAPIGAILILVAVFCIARGVLRDRMGSRGLVGTDDRILEPGTGDDTIVAGSDT